MMRVCSAYGIEMPLKRDSDMDEVRLDVFQSIPEGCGRNTIITLAGRDASLVPEGFEGLVDVGAADIDAGFRMMWSVHDCERTPPPDEIIGMMMSSGCEISKGAFMASSFRDLHSIFAAAESIPFKHVVLGMGDTGAVTRIRQSALGNEFTFGYIGAPTAPGQLDSDRLRGLGDDCAIVGITGDPVSHSRSPAMHDAAFASAGMNAIYLRFGSPDLDMMREVMEEYGIRGMNVTMPHKRDAMELMDDWSRTAGEVGAVNTVTNDDGWFHGDNTDVDGIMRTFEGDDISGRRVLIMGSGGAARAAGYAFMEMGCEAHIAGRNGDAVDRICRNLGTERAESLRGDDYDVVVNCTPIGLVDGRYPADVTCIAEGCTVFDMVYGTDTPLLSHARSMGCRCHDGIEMLVNQGAASFRRWFGFEPDIDAMRRAAS